jgi:hypothetical protein
MTIIFAIVEGEKAKREKIYRILEIACFIIVAFPPFAKKQVFYVYNFLPHLSIYGIP